jgi:hypothetical protein
MSAWKRALARSDNFVRTPSADITVSIVTWHVPPVLPEVQITARTAATRASSKSTRKIRLCARILTSARRLPTFAGIITCVLTSQAHTTANVSFLIRDFC